MTGNTELSNRECFSGADIENLLPHRPPMLLLDRAWRSSEDVLGSGGLYVDPDWVWFVGHYPGAPIMPGVLITEHMAQTACFFLLLNNGQAGKPLLARIEKATFSSPVYPDDYLETAVVLDRRVGNLTQIDARTCRDGKTVAKARLIVGSASE